MSAMTLLPCPFCGNTNDFEGSPWPKDQPGSQNAWFARCGNPNCGAEVVGHTPEEAAALWNTRTTLTQPRAVPDGRKLVGYVWPHECDYDHLHRCLGEDGDLEVRRIPSGAVGVYAIPSQGESA